mmetsp:Transcript_83488/g.258128  ORF Transcript_83488/g.258128 Transcript_83488/m.258128 type:complete len:255 (-) Transcript_83488:25-789(-)
MGAGIAGAPPRPARGKGSHDPPHPPLPLPRLGVVWLRAVRVLVLHLELQAPPPPHPAALLPGDAAGDLALSPECQGSGDLPLDDPEEVPLHPGRLHRLLHAEPEQRPLPSYDDVFNLPVEGGLLDGHLPPEALDGVHRLVCLQAAHQPLGRLLPPHRLRLFCVPRRPERLPCCRRLGNICGRCAEGGSRGLPPGEAAPAAGGKAFATPGGGHEGRKGSRGNHSNSRAPPDSQCISWAPLRQARLSAVHCAKTGA